jgi:pantoate kinase
LPISEEVARRLLARRPGELRVTLAHELPIAQGFGMSAAGALATALAVSSATDGPRRAAVEVAHLADLFGGGGLGGVSAILGGGLEIRERPGIPPAGRVRHRPASGRVILIVAGAAMPSPTLLGNPKFLRRVEEAAGPGLARLRRRPSLDRFLEEAERFTDSLRLGPVPLLRRVHELRTSRTRVAQAMFGRSLFAVTETQSSHRVLIDQLSRRGLWAAEVPLARQGARVLATAPGRVSPLFSNVRP